MIRSENGRTRIGCSPLVFFLLYALNVPPAKAQNAPANLDFESPSANGSQVDPPWFLGQTQQDYEVRIDSNGAYHGKQWIRIRSTHHPTEKEFAKLEQSFDATPYLGKFIRYSAAAKHIGNIQGDARLWMRVDREEKRKCFFSSKTDRPIKATDWEEYKIIGYVAPDAIDIYIGCSLVGAGEIGFDDVKIDTISISSGEFIHNFQMPEYLTFQLVNGGTEDVRSEDIDNIKSAKGKAVVSLLNGRKINASGDYNELAQYYEKSK